MYRIETAPAAEVVLARQPGLRQRLEEVLIGILQTAEELRRLQGGQFDPAGHHLRVQVGAHLVSYRLEPDRRTASVAFLEKLEEAG
jgi:hypothetical protein